MAGLGRHRTTGRPRASSSSRTSTSGIGNTCLWPSRISRWTRRPVRRLESLEGPGPGKVPSSMFYSGWKKFKIAARFGSVMTGTFFAAPHSPVLYGLDQLLSFYFALSFSGQLTRHRSQELNQGRLGMECKRYLCAMPTPLIMDI